MLDNPGPCCELMLDWSSPTDVVFGSEVVKTLKQHCKDVAINGQLCWRIQDQCIYYGIMEELLQWAHEGNKLYSKRYPGKLDYKSKRNEAIALSVLFAWEEASKVLEGIRDNLDSKPWGRKGQLWSFRSIALLS
ncbi:unnamed protein product [Sphagnum balticum]